MDRQGGDSLNYSYCENGGRENYTHPTMNRNLVDQAVAIHFIHWVIVFVTSSNQQRMKVQII